MIYNVKRIIFYKPKVVSNMTVIDTCHVINDNLQGSVYPTAWLPGQAKLSVGKWIFINLPAKFSIICFEKYQIL